jgi:hypothetical protein
MSKPFDVQQLAQALEKSQAEVLRDLYTDDATMKIVDRDRPPSKPMVIAGKDGVSFVEECLYPDGCRVLSAMTCKLTDGRISEHITVQAWDEVSCS